MGPDRLNSQGDLCDQSQAAPAAAKQPHQVIARHIFDHPSAGTGFHAIGPQQADADDLVAHTEVTLTQSTGQAPRHQAANAAGVAITGQINRQPLALFGQQGLKAVEGHPRLHRQGQVVDGMVDDTIQMAAAQYGMAGIQTRPPAQVLTQAAGDPRGGVLMPLAHQLDQGASVGGGMAHGTMVP